MCMRTALFDPQFQDPELSSSLNILAIEPLGHGSTSLPTLTTQFTYWDSAIVALEVMRKLGVVKAFAMGTSQGGWIVVRMALLAPDRILGLLPLGTSMDAETKESQEKGCWDPVPLLKPFVDSWASSSPTPGFVIDDVWCGMVASFGFGSHATDASTAFWTSTLKEVYKGDGGRTKARQAIICLVSCDGLTLRLNDSRCPVYWLQGTEDAPYGSQVQNEQIDLFTAARWKRLEIIDGGAHYLNATHAKQVNEVVLKMVKEEARYTALHSTANMSSSSANLITLNDDVLAVILASIPDLVSLGDCLLAHPVLYRVFNSRRRFVLRNVMKNDWDRGYSIGRAFAYLDTWNKRIRRLKFHHSVDRVALREAFWARLELRLPGIGATNWALDLLVAYQKAGLIDNGLAFAKRTMDIIFQKVPPMLSHEGSTFANSVIQLYKVGSDSHTTIQLQERVLGSMDPRFAQHNVCARELLKSYREIGRSERILPFQLETWELYNRVQGPASEAALDWARSIVREYQRCDREMDAVEFHHNVWKLLHRETPQFVSWSRQLIRMRELLGHKDEALQVTEEVWRHLSPLSPGYQAWTSQLSTQYGAAGRPDDAIRVCEAVWVAYGRLLSREQQSLGWRYHTRTAGIMLAKAYRRHNRLEEAAAIESKCEELRGFPPSVTG
ncbi:alpha/beta-hydrolase [Sporormia fimetaria CBS 119925]|uniref:Alpha/beta-hydrolase n=1 Tax=Sporormia fimetaria CBS 119925 TaxID=1340428 RepID=A0A6A6UUQ4_9PLEO|nr:alpha/beta-hydrolase [Sporormia fimetaria CBS 119925]